MAVGGRAVLVTVLVLIASCKDPQGPECRGHAGNAGLEIDMSFESARHEMVANQLEARGIRDERVLAAMRRVPRHEFVLERWREQAYRDRALPIEHGQTVSQPYIVAAMSELAALDEGAQVLEVGTGSGYQAAVLAEMGMTVYSIEILEPLAKKAQSTLARLGYGAVQVRHGDGYRGWPEASPFDAILVTAAAPQVPRALLEQLSAKGRLVIPVGDWDQQLEVHTRTADGFESRRVFPVRFVPMTGEIRDPPP
ncbi:MAG: protein-L-isoaspartate(D-aspartate) O-methyltransferase [Myxococcota bacterium]